MDLKDVHCIVVDKTNLLSMWPYLVKTLKKCHYIAIDLVCIPFQIITTINLINF